MQHGVGKLTPDVWARIMGVLQWYEGSGMAGISSEDIQAILGLVTAVNRLKNRRDWITAKITGAEELGASTNYRWKYAWEQCVVDASDTPDTIIGGLSGTTTEGFALNLCEVGNTADDVGPSVNVGAAAFPEGFAAQAVGKTRNGVVLGLVVPMLLQQDGEGAARAYFMCANSIDGTCPA